MMLNHCLGTYVTKRNGYIQFINPGAAAPFMQTPSLERCFYIHSAGLFHLTNGP